MSGRAGRQPDWLCSLWRGGGEAAGWGTDPLPRCKGSRSRVPHTVAAAAEAATLATGGRGGGGGLGKYFPQGPTWLLAALYN